MSCHASGPPPACTTPSPGKKSKQKPRPEPRERLLQNNLISSPAANYITWPPQPSANRNPPIRKIDLLARAIHIHTHTHTHTHIHTHTHTHTYTYIASAFCENTMPSSTPVRQTVEVGRHGEYTIAVGNSLKRSHNDSNLFTSVKCAFPPIPSHELDEGQNRASTAAATH